MNERVKSALLHWCEETRAQHANAHAYRAGINWGTADVDDEGRSIAERYPNEGQAWLLGIAHDVCEQVENVADELEHPRDLELAAENWPRDILNARHDTASTWELWARFTDLQAWMHDDAVSMAAADGTVELEDGRLEELPRKVLGWIGYELVQALVNDAGEIIRDANSGADWGEK